MKSNKSGFSLFLFLVYVLFFSIISFFLCSLTINLVIPTLVGCRTYESYMQLYSCTDIFVHDVRSSQLKKVLYISQDEIIWKINDKAIGWRYHDTFLERTEGIYDNKWKKKKSSVVATALKAVEFKLDYKDNILVGISMNLIPINKKQSSIQTYVAVPKPIQLYE